MAQTLLDLTVAELEGVGQALEKKLREAGITSLLDLAAAIPCEVAEAIGCSEKAALELVVKAQDKLRGAGCSRRSLCRRLRLMSGGRG